MDFFSDDNGGHVGFGGNVSGTLNPPGRNKPRATKARLRNTVKRFQVWAGPLIWGPWEEVFAQLGVVGPDADRHVTHITISFSSFSGGPSSFDYEIKGGDRFIRGVAGGSSVSETITITGNVATAISVRAKSHSQGQNIIVTVN